jgi:predicted nucleotidyltransferase
MNVENVVPSVPNEIVEEETMEAGEHVGETSKGNVDKIEVDLERTILMIEDQENVVITIPLLKQENANEDVELHAHIHGGAIAIELHLL